MTDVNEAVRTVRLVGHTTLKLGDLMFHSSMIFSIWDWQFGEYLIRFETSPQSRPCVQGIIGSLLFVLKGLLTSCLRLIGKLSFGEKWESKGGKTKRRSGIKLESRDLE